MLTQERLKDVLEYDPLTGVFTWKVSISNRIRVGEKAGAMSNDGYLRIAIDKKSYLAHRLAWLYQTGEWPEKYIGHIKGKSNHWENLREATSSQNSCNRVSRCDNTSSVKGISWNKARCKWMSYVYHNGVNHYLGLFIELSDAEQAVKQKRLELHGEFTNHG